MNASGYPLLKVLVFLWIVGCILAPALSAAAPERQDPPSSIPSQDPQYVIINLANIKEEYDWNVDDETWNKTVKPALKKELQELRDTLGTGSDQRRLAWSVIVTYNEYPLDIATEQSPYVTYVKRILAVAEEENMPVFLPLNGFQWWNQLPELWNYWDPDGTRTPGCTNSNYSNCPFPELKDPEFRKRFIAGYNPDNKYNVEWINWEDPMPLNTRDWGGGPFQHAPIPNLVDHQQTERSFVDIQKERVDVITQIIVPVVTRWEEEGKGYLFAGISIGTEISLNATIKTGDDFKPYGYRGMQDISCPVEEPTCLKGTNMNRGEMDALRQQIVSRYITTLAEVATRNGIPKQRVYSHVWSEVDPKETVKFVDYYDAANSWYARPGLSMYTYGNIPFALTVLNRGLKKYGEPVWAIPEFSSSDDSWAKALEATLNNDRNPARLINIYNKREIWNKPAVPAVREFLTKPVITPQCTLSEIQTITPEHSNTPSKLDWEPVQKKSTPTEASVLLYRYDIPLRSEKPAYTLSVEANKTELKPDYKQIEPGLYHWIVIETGCDGARTVSSLPQKITVFPVGRFTWWDKFWLSLPDLSLLVPKK